MEKNDLVSMYAELASEVERLQSELAASKDRARETLQLLMATHGKGPYTVNGKEVVVLQRKGTMCTMPATRVRKNTKELVGL